jgi:DNA-binding response OmpR family regulator
MANGGDGRRRGGKRQPPPKPLGPPRSKDFDALPTVPPPPLVPKSKLAAEPARGQPVAPEPSPPGAAVLLVGSKYEMLEGLRNGLESRGLAVETTTKDELPRVVVAAAPDLIVLLGDAAADGGQEIVRQLSASKLSSVVPVVLLTDDDRLDARVRAFRHGIAAFVKASPSVDGIAAELARLAEEIPDREGIDRGSAGRTTLADLVDLLSNEVRSGILSVTPGGSTGSGGVQVVLGDGRPVAEIIDEFVSRLKTQVVSAEPLEYEFDERAGGTVQLLSAGSIPPPSDTTNLAGVRVLLADDDAARADAVAQALRREGLTAVVTDLAPEAARFERLRLLDPAILVIGERQLKRGAELVRRMRDDARLRWVSLLVVRWEEIWPAGVVDPSVDSIRTALATLVESERAILSLARNTAAAGFDTRLEILGPARLLRTLAEAERSLRVSVHSPRVRVTIDLAQGLVVGASGRTYGPDASDLAGIEALAALLVLGSGRVRVEQVEQAQHANVMAPVEIAVNQALSEEPPIPPSRAPPASALRAIEAALSAPVESEPPPLPVETSAVATPVPDTSRSRDSEPKPRRSAFPRVISALVVTALIAGAAIWLVKPSLLAHLWAPPAPTEMPPAPQLETPEPSGPPAARVESTEPAAPEAAAPSPLERAASGDPDALAKLEAQPPESRTPEESIALARGRTAAKRRELEELRSSLGREPARAAGSEALARLATFARDPEVAADALRILAELPGPDAADVLYEIWTGTPERTPATELASELVLSAEVRGKASAALAAVLDLRRAKTCEEVRDLLPRLTKQADQRAVRPLVRLLQRSGCGPGGATDCHPCLRGSRQLTDAITAVERRPAPPTAGSKQSAGAAPPSSSDKPPAIHRPREP